MQASTRTRRPIAAAPAFPCRGNPELFFAEDPQDVLRAKALCRGCPVQAACLAGALQRGEPCGVWGGELLQRGMVIAEKRARGRPRKSSCAGPARTGAGLAGTAARLAGTAAGLAGTAAGLAGTAAGLAGTAAGLAGTSPGLTRR
jgi:WhiB family transcriptional regulator, redox-sensing transcriptional regulator